MRRLWPETRRDPPAPRFRRVVRAAVLLSLTTGAAWSPTSSASIAGQDADHTYWIDVRGLSPQQTEVIAAGFAREAGEEGLTAADRPELASLLVRLSAETSAAPGIRGRLFVDATAGAPDGIDDPSRGLDAVRLRLGLIDVIEGVAISDEPLDCELPLTRGRAIAALCLRRGFARIIDRMAESTIGPAAVAIEPSAAAFGPPDPERAALSGADLGEALVTHAEAAARAGFEDRALELMAEAQPLLREAGMRREEGRAWSHIAYLMAARYRDADRAVAYAEEAVRIARELGDPTAEARALSLLAACEGRRGGYTRAQQLASEAAALSRGAEDGLGEGIAMAIRGGLAGASGDFETALAIQAEAFQRVATTGNPRIEARVSLAMAVVTAQDDDRLRSGTLARLEEIRQRAWGSGDVALSRDVAFIMADTRFATTDLEQSLAGEVDAIRAYRLATRLEDAIGQTAATGLLGMYALRLQKPAAALDYLVRAHRAATAAGFVEGEADTLQALGEFVDDRAAGVAYLIEVVSGRARQRDLRGQIKALSDLSRFQSVLGQTDDARRSFQGALSALDEYVRQLQASPDGEDIRAGLPRVLTSLIATETPFPYLARYLRIDHMIPLPNPVWLDP